MKNLRRSRFDIPAENECPDCYGTGMSVRTESQGLYENGKWTTTELGYGCLRCLGIGRLPESLTE
jgi:hypothetical protein